MSVKAGAIRRWGFFIVMPSLAILFMIAIDIFCQLDYWLRSICKIFMFAGVPVLIACMQGMSLRDLFRWQGKKSFLLSIGLGILTYIAILILYMLFSRFIDLVRIRIALEDTMNVTSANFMLVGLYIACINSFLEEFFFRGILFVKMKAYFGRGFVYGFSSIAFSIYHVAMISAWFSPWIFSLIIVGLVGVGIFFNA